jgi:uncharacterized protein (TIGR03067 family)
MGTEPVPRLLEIQVGFRWRCGALPLYSGKTAIAPQENVMKNRCVLPALLISLAVLGNARADDQAKKDLAKFQGTWTATSYIVDGKAPSKKLLKSLKLTVKEDVSAFTKEGETTHGTYRLDPSKKPKTLDILFTDGPHQGKTSKCIYELKGDALRICLASPGKKRPTALASKAGSGLTLEAWKRSKPEKGKAHP